jgi:hypothetical protein
MGQKKGPLVMNKRPKSREETPKEGSGNARRYRTATICDRAAQSARVFERFPMQKTQGSPALTETQIQFILLAISIA